MVRTLVLWCPDWPLTAAAITAEQPAAVFASEQVVACTTAARAAGVRIGLRRREAQSRCPSLTTLDADPARDARAFQPVVAAVQELVPSVEVVRPGLMMLAVRGPSRVFGGEQAVAAALASTVDQAVASSCGVAGTQLLPCHLGVADTRFAALVAARQTAIGTAKGPVEHTPATHIPPGEDAAFLAEQPVQVLLHGLRPEQDSEPWRSLVDLLRQLGLYRLGDLAALPALNIADRFGSVGTLAHRWACGFDDQPIVPLESLPDLAVRVELDEPASLVETIAFAVRRPAETLIEQLARRSLTCTLLTIEVQTEHAEQLTRRWRTGGFTPALVVDRVRWQLDGWISGSAGVTAPTAGIVLVRLDPTEIIEGGSQSSLLDRAAPSAAVTQAITRLQGMLGPDAVLVGVPNGGRDPGRWVTAVPWDESLQLPQQTSQQPSRPASQQPSRRSSQQPSPQPSRPASQQPSRPASQQPSRQQSLAAESTGLPWPGRLPSPAPATVLADPVDTDVIDRDKRPVTVSGRGVISAAPWQLRFAGGAWHTVTGWAGPWPADERWWEATGRRRARFQMTTEVGIAYLLAIQDGRWRTEALYD